MKIQYRLDEKDLALVLPYRSRNLPSFRRFLRSGYRVAGGAAALGLVAGLGCFTLIADPSAGAYWGSWSLCLFFWGLFMLLWIWLVMPATMPGRAKRLVKLHPDMAGDFTLELSDEGLTEYSEGRTLRLAWRRIEKLVIHRNFLLIFSEPLTSLILPLRVFDDQRRGEEFLNRLTSAAGRPLSGRLDWDEP